MRSSYIGFCVRRSVLGILSGVWLWGCSVSVAQEVPGSAGLDYFLTPHTTLQSTRLAALGNAGVALLDGNASASVNPALVHTFYRTLPGQKLSFGAGLGRDSLFDFVIPVNASWHVSNDLGTIGFYGKYCVATDSTDHQEFSLFCSSRLFDHSVEQGAVDFGFTFRYEKTRWGQNRFDRLFSVEYVKAAGVFSPVDTIDTSDASITYIEQQRLLLDVGFFQAHIADHVDFGLTLKNIAGYCWNRWNPSVKRVSVIHDPLPNIIGVTARDTFGRTDTALYVNEYQTGDAWLNPRYSSLVVGVAVTIPKIGRYVVLRVPADFEFVGLLEPQHNVNTLIRCGVEAQIKDTYFVRVGYARTPRSYPSEQLIYKNENAFSAGAGVVLQNFVGNFYIANGAWGFDASVGF